MYVQTISKSRPATKPLHATGSKRIGCATHGLPMSIGIYIYNLYVFTVHVQKINLYIDIKVLLWPKHKTSCKRTKIIRCKLFCRSLGRNEFLFESRCS